MRYTGYTIILDPTTFETKIYLKREGDEDGAMDDCLALDPAGADRLSGALIQSNAERKRLTAKAAWGSVADRFRRR